MPPIGPSVDMSPLGYGWSYTPSIPVSLCHCCNAFFWRSPHVHSFNLLIDHEHSKTTNLGDSALLLCLGGLESP